MKTYCKNGHRLAGDNVRLRRRGNHFLRVCRACDREYRARKRAAAAQSNVKWAVLDARQQVMRCARCGKTKALTEIKGVPVHDALGIIRAFVEAHTGCRPVRIGVK